jgi:hypothetical protein
MYASIHPLSPAKRRVALISCKPLPHFAIRKDWLLDLISKSKLPPDAVHDFNVVKLGKTSTSPKQLPIWRAITSRPRKMTPSRMNCKRPWTKERILCCVLATSSSPNILTHFGTWRTCNTGGSPRWVALYSCQISQRQRGNEDNHVVLTYMSLLAFLNVRTLIVTYPLK